MEYNCCKLVAQRDVRGNGGSSRGDGSSELIVHRWQRYPRPASAIHLFTWSRLSRPSCEATSNPIPTLSVHFIQPGMFFSAPGSPRHRHRWSKSE